MPLSFFHGNLEKEKMLTGTTIVIGNDKFSFIAPPADVNCVDVTLDIRERSYGDVAVRAFGKWDAAIQRQIVEERVSNHRPSFIMYSGFIIGTASLFIKDNETLIVELIAILPEWQNINLGSAIVRCCMSIAEHSNKDLTLKVLKVSRACALYERMGFVTYSEDEYMYNMVRRCAPLA